MPVGGIEPADVRAAVGRVPDLALGVARRVVAGDIESRQFVFGDYDLGLPTLRPRLHDEVRVFRIGPADRGEPARELALLLRRQAPRIADIDQRGTGTVSHAEDDVGPAALVIAVAENLLILMAEIAIDRQRLLLLTGAGQVLQPFRSGELCRDLREGRQEFTRRHAQKRYVTDCVGAFDLHLGPGEGIEFARLGDAQRIGARHDLGKFVVPIITAVDCGADRGLVRDELHHDAFDRLAADILDEAFRPSGQRSVERRASGRGRALVARVERQGIGIPTALLVAQPAHEVGQVGLVENILVGRHVGATVEDLGLDGIFVDGIPADQRRALEQADELRRTALRQFVVTHPAFVKVDFLAAGRAALGRRGKEYAYS